MNIYLNATAWAIPEHQDKSKTLHWVTCRDMAVRLGHGIRMDAMFWFVGKTEGKWNVGLIENAARDCKKHKLKLRLILGYGTDWDQRKPGLKDGMGDRPHPSKWKSYVTMSNAVIKAAQKAYGSGFRKGVSFEWWNEPGRNGGVDLGWDHHFLAFSAYVVPRLRLNGSDLWAPTLHGHAINIERDARQMDELAGLWDFFKKFDGWNATTYNSQPTDSARTNPERMATETIGRMVHTEQVIRACPNLMAISPRIINSEFGVGYPQMGAAHIGRVKAMDLAVLGVKEATGYESVSPYRVMDFSPEEERTHAYGLCGANGEPYSRAVMAFKWK